MESKQEHPSTESKEKLLHEILGKISIMRHGETKYTEQYPDLTELGKKLTK